MFMPGKHYVHMIWIADIKEVGSVILQWVVAKESCKEGFSEPLFQYHDLAFL